MDKPDVQILKALLQMFDNTGNTGCPINWYSLSISIPDFSNGPIKKI